MAKKLRSPMPWPSERRLIVNADDFGSSLTVNAAVLRAHREGVLTSASIMAAGAAFGQAVDIAKATPDLAVGLHLVTVHGPATLSPMRLRHIVGPDGRFVGTPLSLGVRYAFSATARRELAAELAAQFERFAATGLPLSHVNGHLHMHMHPTILNLVVALASHYGARGVRLPRDSLRSTGVDIEAPQRSRPRARRQLRQLRRAGLPGVRAALRSGGCPDSAVEVVTRLQHDYPDREIRLMVAPPEQANRKASMLDALSTQARTRSWSPAIAISALGLSIFAMWSAR